MSAIPRLRASGAPLGMTMAARAALRSEWHMASVDPHPTLHRRDQLRRVVADAVLEDRRHLANHARIRGEIALQHDEIRELSFLHRAELVSDAEDLRAVRRHDLHGLCGSEACLDEQLIVALIAEARQRTAEARRVDARSESPAGLHERALERHRVRSEEHTSELQSQSN